MSNFNLVVNKIIPSMIYLEFYKKIKNWIDLSNLIDVNKINLINYKINMVTKKIELYCKK